MESAHHGSCLCGSVTYAIRGDFGPVTWCHCQKCRKGNGTAFLVVTSIKEEDFDFLTGKNLVTEYESTPGVTRNFCSRCGSPFYGKRTNMPGILRLRIGTLDTPCDGHADQHIFTAYKADWFDIHDGAPQHPERP